MWLGVVYQMNVDINAGAVILYQVRLVRANLSPQRSMKALHNGYQPKSFQF